MNTPTNIEPLWLAWRNEAGELVPQAPIHEQTLRCLSVTAGTLGLKLGEWMATILRVHLKCSPAPPAPPAPSPVQCVEIEVDADSREELERYNLSCDEFDSPGDAADCLIHFAGMECHAFMAAGLAHRSPEAVAEALLSESKRRMRTEGQAVSRMEEVERQAFAAGMAAGRWSRELATALA